jgi:hypothetical protein
MRELKGRCPLPRGGRYAERRLQNIAVVTENQAFSLNIDTALSQLILHLDQSDFSYKNGKNRQWVWSVPLSVIVAEPGVGFETELPVSVSQLTRRRES